MISRKDLILAGFATCELEKFTPVQVQKLFFLCEMNISESYLGGKKFNFTPYDYGPYDSDVYRELETLQAEGFVDIQNNGKWNEFRLTPDGLDQGLLALKKMDSQASDYLSRAAKFVRSLSFSELVSSIYKAYPEMKEKSVFQGT